MFSIIIDRVVHHEARRNRQRHQRQIVQTVAQQVHHAERADQRQRHRDARNDRRRDAAHEQEHDHHHERDGQQQRELNVLHGGADRRRAVGEDLDVDCRRQRAFQRRQQLLDPIHDFDNVGPRLALDVDDHGRRLIHPRSLLDVFGVVHHGRHIG